MVTSESLLKKPKENRFELVTEKDAEKSAKGVVPRNTEKNNRWALNTFKAWISKRNDCCKELSRKKLCPEDVLDGDNAELLNKWLSLFVMEVRKVDGSCYPPLLIHLILCGLQCYMRRNNDLSVNVFDKQDLCFRGLRGTVESVYQSLHKEESRVGNSPRIDNN